MSNGRENLTARAHLAVELDHGLVGAVLHRDALGDVVQRRQEASGGHVGEGEEVGLAQGLHGGGAGVSGSDVEAQLGVLGQVGDLCDELVAK